MSRCGCNQTNSNSTCACFIGGGDCIDITGSGTSVDPFVIAPVIDPDETNLLECGASGLLVPRSGPLGLLAYASIESQSAGTDDTLIDVITLAPVTPIGANRMWKLWFHTAQPEGDTVGDVLICQLMEGASQLNRTTGRIQVANQEENGLSIGHLIIPPTEGAHTYKIAIRRNSGGAGLVNISGNAQYPSWLALEDLGALP